jgi:exodeoxyribonuclease-3
VLLASANVNGIRAARRRGGLEWLARSGADVLALQEVRAGGDQLTAALAGSAFERWSLAHADSSAAGRAGVAVLTPYPVRAVRTDLADLTNEFAGSGRWVEADLEVWAAQDRLAVVTGDLNIAHRAEDLRNWKGNRGKSGFLPEEQAHLDRWIEDHGFVDVHRTLHGPGPGPYTWWSWRGQAFDNDAGWRIDYQFASAPLAALAVRADVGRASEYALRWSDHAPVLVDYAL